MVEMDRGGGFSGKKGQLGVRTTKALKKVGCSNFKTGKQIRFFQDFDTIVELPHSYLRVNLEAEEDLQMTWMCMVLFGWLSDQTYFKELTNSDIRNNCGEKKRISRSRYGSFGFVLDGVHDEYGTDWTYYR